MIPYGVWLHAVNPLVVYKVPLHIAWALVYFWGYGMLLASFGLAYVQWMMSAHKKPVSCYRLSRFYWLIVVFVIIIAGGVDETMDIVSTGFSFIPYAPLPFLVNVYATNWAGGQKKPAP